VPGDWPAGFPRSGGVAVTLPRLIVVAREKGLDGLPWDALVVRGRPSAGDPQTRSPRRRQAADRVLGQCQLLGGTGVRMGASEHPGRLPEPRRFRVRARAAGLLLPPGRRGAGGHLWVTLPARWARGSSADETGKCQPATTIFPSSPSASPLGPAEKTSSSVLAAFPLPNLRPHRPSMTIGWPPGPRNWPRWVPVSGL
jgi:hypothetical protein